MEPDPDTLPGTERVARLRAWAGLPTAGDNPEGQVQQLMAAAAALGLYIEARASLPLLNVTSLLRWSAVAVQAALSLCARHSLPTEAVKGLWRDVQAQHQEAGRPPLAAFKPGASVPSGIDALHEARHAARRARHVQLRRATARSRGMDALLWEVFDRLHSRPLPYTPLDELTLSLAARWALPLPAIATSALAQASVGEA